MAHAASEAFGLRGPKLSPEAPKPLKRGTPAKSTRFSVCRLTGLSDKPLPPLRGSGSTLLRFPGRCPGLHSAAPPGRATGDELPDRPLTDHEDRSRLRQRRAEC